MRRLSLDIKTYMILFLSLLFVINIYRTGIAHATAAAITISSAVLLDALFIRINKRRFEFPKSALVTGLIISELVEPEAALRFLYFLPPVFAILSKHLIKVSNRHIFNPAAFGLFVTTLIFPTGLTWWAAKPIYLVLIFGAVIVYKIRGYPHVLAFVIISLALFSSQAVFRHAPILDSLYMINPFFAGFILTEPKTAPMTIKKKAVYGGIVGISSFVLLQLLPQYDYSIFALLVGNLFVPFLKRPKPNPSPGVTAWI